jgi:hypothetical protein
MAVLKIPTSTDLASYNQRTALDGRDFILNFIFNQRLGRWFLDIADQDGVAIASGLGLVSNFVITRNIVDERRPAGEIFVIDLEGAGEDPDVINTFSRDPGLKELGERFILVYFDAEELGREA